MNPSLRAPPAHEIPHAKMLTNIKYVELKILTQIKNVYSNKTIYK